ncbi:hypothetical protein FFLO_00014 [Filobasidium floriforme]|uniref:Vacuolar-sorting protein SNF7 n=1 Tax=Filobasidium floriforme TaxID=5210 RepID=A0A8K0JS25_9TREE|nr:Snf7-domain-containing protein [Filobasidium floriforme]KAG7580043.1 hypothetical protein FFLO_00014 [Filobasidium floriforme]KAH8090724.1 Snf7-domain-containing protein [Filobasidium floriforme]
MSGWMSYFTGKPKDSRQSARDSIVGLRSQLLVLDKREEFLQKKIEEELKKAKTNATANKRLALAALRQKQAYEGELNRIAGTRLTLEAQVNAIETANLNAETMVAMKKGADALKGIHGSLNINKVDATMESIREQMDLSNEISDAISNPVNMGIEVDDDELKNELEELEQEQLNERLVGAERAPVHAPVSAGPSRVSHQQEAQRQEEEDDEEAQLRALQAEMAM